jgi:hypothetical protein
MSPNPQDEVEDARRIMGALVRMPPKPHDEMKLGKAKAKSKKAASNKPNKNKESKAMEE